MEDNWREKYNIMIGERGNYPGDYSEMLARSKFCLVLPGGFGGGCRHFLCQCRGTWVHRLWNGQILFASKQQRSSTQN
jgi:hypothetical protein